MRILFYLPDFWPGGAQKQAALLFKEVNRIHPNCARLLYVRSGPNMRWLGQEHQNIRQLHFQSLMDPRILLALKTEVRSFRATHIVSWLHGGDSACGVFKLLFPAPIKWILMERDSAYPAGWKFSLRKLIGKRADRVIANSAEGAEYWKKLQVASASIGQIRNIVPPLDCIGSPSIEKEIRGTAAGASFSSGSTILYVGRLEEQKAIQRVLSSMILANKQHGMQGFIAGSGSKSEEVREQIKQSGAEEGVRFLGFVDRPETLFANKPIFLSLSKHEGTPNALLEAIQHGCLPVLSRIPEHTAIVGAAYPFLVDSHETPAAVAQLCAKANAIPLNERKKHLDFGLKYIDSSSANFVAKAFLNELALA